VSEGEQIALVETDEDYAAFGVLVAEYLDWLRQRYESLPGFIDAVGSHQGLAAELASLNSVYGPPRGRALLARRGAQVVGGIALRDRGEGACEMKRLFVPERFQGTGTGRRLCQALLDVARADGYSVMRLDTGEKNVEAIAMYAALGFRECPPYHDYADSLLEHLTFMERTLTD
jgi:GNAT superfamily N-acetyltransferase